MFDQQASDMHLHASKMERTRLQQKGDLYEQGGWWKLRWREDQRLADGSVKYGWSKPVVIGPSEGRGKFTEKQARRIAWDNHLSRLDQNMRTPQSIMTVAEFVERRFIPEHVAMQKKSGRVHYQQQLANVLDGIPEKRRSFKGLKRGAELPEIPRRCGIGEMRLRDVTHEDVQRLVSEAIQRGYSVQTAKHIRTCASAIFTHAEKKGWFSGRNPAHFVELPEMTRRPVRALTFEELQALLFALKPTARAMVLCASLTSMNIAEVCGLRWKRVNLTAAPVVVDGESIPAHHIAVREQWYRREFGSVKAKARRRNVPMAKLLVEALTVLRKAAVNARQISNPQGDDRMERNLPLRGLAGEGDDLRRGGAVVSANAQREGLLNPDAVVFAGRDGRPVDAGAMLKRQVRKAAAGIGAPNLGWHDLRRTFATLADQLGISIGERQALMGHARAAQTLDYTHTDSTHAMAALERMGEKVGKETVN